MESVYEEAVAHEFTLRGIIFGRQKEIELDYKGKKIGRDRIDCLIEQKVILEIKAIDVIKKLIL